MPKVWEKTKEINEQRTLAVSASGRGLYLYLPKDFCQLHGIAAGDRILVKFLTHFKLKYQKE